MLCASTTTELAEAAASLAGEGKPDILVSLSVNTLAHACVIQRVAFIIDKQLNQFTTRSSVHGSVVFTCNIILMSLTLAAVAVDCRGYKTTTGSVFVPWRTVSPRTSD